MQKALMTFLNNEERKLNYHGSLLLGLIREDKIDSEDATKALLDLFEQLTDSVSKVYTAMLCCGTTTLLKEAVEIANAVSFDIAAFGVTINELEAQSNL
jgi:hypothetical protein